MSCGTKLHLSSTLRTGKLLHQLLTKAQWRFDQKSPPEGEEEESGGPGFLTASTTQTRISNEQTKFHFVIISTLWEKWRSWEKLTNSHPGKNVGKILL